VQTLTDHLSTTERRADDATREVTRWLKASYMMDKIGEEFDGIISGVTTSASLSNWPRCMWMVWYNITSLGTIIITSIRPSTACWVSVPTAATVSGGDAVRVKVAQVNLDEAKLDFELVGEVKREARREPRRDGQEEWWQAPRTQTFAHEEVAAMNEEAVGGWHAVLALLEALTGTGAVDSS